VHDNLPNAGSGFGSQLLFYTIPPGPIPAWVEFADLALITWKVSTCTSFLKCFLLRYARLSNRNKMLEGLHRNTCWIMMNLIQSDTGGGPPENMNHGNK
jgi:hypothetical protein